MFPELDLIPIAETIVQQDFVLIWCAVVVGYAALFGLRFLYHALVLGRALRKAKKPLRGVDGEAAFAEMFESYDQEVRSLQRLRHPWSEFTESLVISLPESGLRAIQNTREPSYYLNDATVVHPTINLRWYGSIPNHLTAMGILGTFVGLAAGITLAQNGLAQSDIKEVQASLGFLLKGASLAFFTSIFGISCSLGFLMMERVVVRRLHGSLGQWVNLLEASLRLITPESVMLDLFAENQRQTKQLERFNTDLAVEIGAALEERVADKLVPELEKLIAAVEGARSDQANATEEMLGALVRDFRQSLSQGAGAEMEAMSNTLGSLNQSLVASSQAMEQNNREMKSTMEAVAAALRESVASSSGAMQQGLHDALAQVTGAVSEATREMKASIDQSMQSMQDSMRSGANDMQHGVAATMASVADSLASSSSTMQANLRNGVDELTDRIGDAGASLARDLEESSARAAGRLGEVMQSYDTGVKRLEDLGSTCERIVAVSGELLRRSESLTAAFDEASKGIQSTSAPLLQSARSLEQSGREVAACVDKIAASGAAVENGVRALEASNGSVAEQWRSYEARFRDVDLSLKKIFQEMDSGLQRYLEQVQVFSRELDQETARSLKGLSAATGELQESVEQLLEGLNENRRQG